MSIYNNWISVQERLPDAPGQYMTTWRGAHAWNRNVVAVGIDSFRGKTSWAQKENKEVIAWCDLPEPYNPSGGPRK